MSEHQNFNKAYAAICQAKQVLIMMAKSPDGDNLGSNMALFLALKREGVPCAVFSFEKLAAYWNYLPGIESVITDISKLVGVNPDVVITSDVSDLPFSGLDQVFPLLPSKPTTINFDHHRTNDYFADINIVMPKASASAEVILQFFQSQNIKVDKHIATCLLTGIITDTGGFSNPATTNNSLSSAAQLISHGGRFGQIVNFTYKNKTVADLKLWGRVLGRLTHNPKWDIATTVITQNDIHDFGIDKKAVEGVANFLNNYQGSRAIIVLRETEDGKIKASMRTTQEGVDLSKFALFMGGGGHKKAAGFTIDGAIKQTKDGWKIV